MVLLTKGFNPLRGYILSGSFALSEGLLRGDLFVRGLAIPGGVLKLFTTRLIDSGHVMTILAYGLRVWKY